MKHPFADSGLTAEDPADSNGSAVASAEQHLHEASALRALVSCLTASPGQVPAVQNDEIHL